MGWTLHPWDSFRHNFLQPRNSSYQPDRIEMAWSLQPIRDVFRVCISLLVWNSTCNTAFKVCNKHSLLLTQLDIGATLRHISGELQQHLKPYGLRNTLSNIRLQHFLSWRKWNILAIFSSRLDLLDPSTCYKSSAPTSMRKSGCAKVWHPPSFIAAITCDSHCGMGTTTWHPWLIPRHMSGIIQLAKGNTAT